MPSKSNFKKIAKKFLPPLFKNSNVKRSKTEILSTISSWSFKKKNKNVKRRSTNSNDISDWVDKNSSQSSKLPITDYFELTNKVLGKGHYGIVIEGKCNYTEELVAIKSIKIRDKYIKNIKNEIKILSYVNHPTVMSLIDVFVTDTTVHLVLPLFKGGDLLDRLYKEGNYKEFRAKYHLRKLALAIKYLHDKNIIHRDLKPENILLKTELPNSEMVIADFGVSKFVDNLDHQMTSICGTLQYSPPEMNIFRVLTETPPKPYTSKVDTWSYGVIMYMMLVAYHPFDPHPDPHCRSTNDIWKYIQNGIFDYEDVLWDNISYGAKDLINKLLVIDPNERLSINDVLQHPWFFEGMSSKKSKKKLKKIKSFPVY